MAKPKKVQVETIYTASLNIKAQRANFTAKGATITEAIGKLEPVNPKGMAILTVSNGEKTKERVLQPKITQQLFGNRSGMAREVFLKNTAFLFQGFDA